MAEIGGERGWLHSDFAQAIGPASLQIRQQEILAGIASLIGEIEHLDRTGAVDSTRAVGGPPGDNPAPGLATAEAELAQMRTANLELRRRLRDTARQLDEMQHESAAERTQLEGELVESRRKSQALSAQLRELREQIAGQAEGLAARQADCEGLTQQPASAKVELEQVPRTAKSDSKSPSAQVMELRPEATMTELAVSRQIAQLQQAEMEAPPRLQSRITQASSPCNGRRIFTRDNGTR